MKRTIITTVGTSLLTKPFFVLNVFSVILPFPTCFIGVSSFSVKTRISKNV